jgi:hypothetical protein
MGMTGAHTNIHTYTYTYTHTHTHTHTHARAYKGLDVLDLGSGSGQDCYLAAALVGPDGNCTFPPTPCSAFFHHLPRVGGTA